MATWFQAGVNAVIALSYLGIATSVLVPLVRSGQLVRNRLATATGCIFLSCAAGHGEHMVHGLQGAEPLDVHLLVIDGLTAMVGVFYWTLRSQYGRLLESPKLFDDPVERARQAMEINDNVVQGLAVAKLALDRGEVALASGAVQAALQAAQDLIDEGIGGPDRLQGGQLRRTTPAHLLGVDA